nr:823_t:CDS:10 [Entrophospora candida]
MIKWSPEVVKGLEQRLAHAQNDAAKKTNLTNEKNQLTIERDGLKRVKELNELQLTNKDNQINTLNIQITKKDNRITQLDKTIKGSAVFFQTQINIIDNLTKKLDAERKIPNNYQTHLKVDIKRLAEERKDLVKSKKDLEDAKTASENLRDQEIANLRAERDAPRPTRVEYNAIINQKTTAETERNSLNKLSDFRINFPWSSYTGLIVASVKPLVITQEEKQIIGLISASENLYNLELGERQNRVRMLTSEEDMILEVFRRNGVNKNTSKQELESKGYGSSVLGNKLYPKLELKITSEHLTIEELIAQFKQQIPTNYLEIKPEEGNYMYIPHNLLEKLKLVKGEDIINPLYLSPNLLEREPSFGGITVENETEIILVNPSKIIVKEQETQTDLNNQEVEDLKNENNYNSIQSQLTIANSAINQKNTQITNLTNQVSSLNTQLTTTKNELAKEQGCKKYQLYKKTFGQSSQFSDDLSFGSTWAYGSLKTYEICWLSNETPNRKYSSTVIDWHEADTHSKHEIKRIIEGIRSYLAKIIGETRLENGKFYKYDFINLKTGCEDYFLNNHQLTYIPHLLGKLNLLESDKHPKFYQSFEQDIDNVGKENQGERALTQLLGKNIQGIEEIDSEPIKEAKLKLSARQINEMIAKGLTPKVIVNIARVSERTIYRRRKIINQSIPLKTGRKPKILGSILEVLYSYVFKNNRTTQKDMVNYLFQEMGLKMIKPLLKTNLLLATDESGFPLNLAPTRGYALKGQRVLAHKSVKGAVNAEIFANFFSNVNLPDDVKFYLLLDNIRFHYSKEVKEMLANKNIEPIYLVPYSPQLNPVEEIFNVIKQYVRQQRPTTEEELRNAIIRIITEIQKEGLANLVGGLEHKVPAAVATGVKKLILSAEQKEDYEKVVPQEIREKLRVFYVKNVEELEELFFRGEFS